MQEIIRMLKLKRGAELLDSKAYILKAIFAVGTAYYLGVRMPSVNLDMISLLFGVMLTLEPVNLGGLRSGKAQIYATLLGIFSGSLLVLLLGVNVFSVALSVGLTLYIALKINWREVPVIAFFTAIYMTQYLQINALGEPSVFLTAKLRLSALVFGIFIGMLYNLIFSFISYQKIADKRIIYCVSEVANQTELLLQMIQKQGLENIEDIIQSIYLTFSNIDWVIGVFLDIKRENAIKKRLGIKERDCIDIHLNIAVEMRATNHSLNDIAYTMLKQKQREISHVEQVNLEEILEKLRGIEQGLTTGQSVELLELTNQDPELSRIGANLLEMRYSINSTIQEVNQLCNK